jgi:glycosyltransferase involved in cell wall biosynthesis
MKKTATMKNRILIIASLDSSLIRFRGDLIKSWIAAGYEVHAAAPGMSTKESMHKLGAEYYSLPLKRVGLNPLEDIYLLYSLIMLMVKIKPGYMFLYTAKPVIYGSIAAYFCRPCQVYAMITGLGSVFTDIKIKSKIIRLLITVLYKIGLKRNRTVFFQNPDDLKLFTERNIVNQTKAVLVNGSGVNLDYFRFVPAVVEPIVFLLIARLMFEKGIVEYVEAARLIKARYPQAIFRLVGWRLESGLGMIADKQVEVWKNEGVVQIAGETDDVRPFIAESSVYVLPSYREGTPRTVLEAMAMGRPIITTDAPGCRETVTDGVNGYLVPTRDIKALAAAMERFILEPELISQMGKASRKIAEDKYDVQKVNKVINKAMGLL